MTQDGVVELEAMLHLVEGLLVDFDVHQHVMRLEHFAERISQLAAAPVFDAVDFSAGGLHGGAVALDHGGHLLALVRMDDKYDFVVTHSILLVD